MSGSVTRNRKNADIFKKAMADIESHCVKIGFFEDSKYDKVPVAYVAAIQEFGYAPKNIPARSFMRTTQKEKKQKYTDLALKGFAACGKGRISAENVYGRLGFAAQGDVFKKIESIRSPKLKERTIKDRKRRMANGGRGATAGITKPLIDLGILLAAVQYQVSSPAVDST